MRGHSGRLPDICGGRALSQIGGMEMNIVEKILERVKALYSDFVYVWGKCDELSEWDSLAEIKANWALLQDVAARAVLCVEYCAGEIKNELKVLVTSAEKKKAAVAYLDAWIKLPVYMEWVDDMVLGWMVDSAVAALNKKYGQEWGLTSKSAVATMAKAEGVGK